VIQAYTDSSAIGFINPGYLLTSGRIGVSSADEWKYGSGRPALQVSR